jgi:aminoglycoside phosphotransferase (APT) family kinase protein
MLTPAEVASRLESFLRQQGVEARVKAARQLTGGASRDTWSVDAEIDGQPAGLVVRRDMGGEIMDEALDRAGEFAVLKRAYDGGVLVARPRWLCLDRSVLGSDFFVTDRVEGESVGRRVVREPALESGRRALPAQMGEQLARIHALSFEGLDFLPRPRPGESPARRALARTAAQLRSLGEPHPALELALRWLAARAPECPRLILVHRDFRIGNLMVGPTGLVAVFDWEFAHIGDPHEDLAWPCVRSWRFGQDRLKLGGVGQPEEFFAAYERAGGARVDPAAVGFWEAMGNLRWAVGCVAQAHRHLSGQAPSVELASLGRRACEMELELLDLIARAGGAP